MKSNRLVLCLVCWSLLTGCSDDRGDSRRDGGGSSISRWNQWESEPAIAESRSKEQPLAENRQQAVPVWKRLFKQESPTKQPQVNEKPAVRKTELAVKKEPLPLPIVRNEKKPPTKQKPAPPPIAGAGEKFQVKEKPPTLVVKRPVAKRLKPTPKRKQVAGIDWHTSLPAALKEASQGDGKPVLCFRVLGDLSGFM